MQKNLGKIDRLIRSIVALALLGVGLFVPLATGWRTFLFILASFELLSAATAY